MKGKRKRWIPLAEPVMDRVFDPYHKWLGIRDPQRPPNHYRLLGLDPFEDDPDVIAEAAQRQMAHLRTYQLGPHSAHSQKLLNELAAAKICLFDPAKKQTYDQALRKQCRGLDPHPTEAVGEAGPAAILQELVDRGSETTGLTHPVVTGAWRRNRLAEARQKQLLLVGVVSVSCLILGWCIGHYGRGSDPEIAFKNADTAADRPVVPPAPPASEGDLPTGGNLASPRASSVASALPGIQYAGELDCTARAYLMDIPSPIDVSQSWTLSLEFLAPTLEEGLHMLFVWGDDRPGRDVIFVRQNGAKLEGMIQDCALNTGHAIYADLDENVPGRWKPVMLRYDASERSLELHVDHRLIAKEPAAVSPAIDRPMPIWIGGSNANGQRFQGKIRSLSLGQETGVAPQNGANSSGPLQPITVLPTPTEQPGWEQLTFSGVEIMDGFVRCGTEPGIATKAKYSGPLEITVEARTVTGKNIRLRAFDWAAVIFNWEINPRELRVSRPDGSLATSAIGESAEVHPLRAGCRR